MGSWYNEEVWRLLSYDVAFQVLFALILIGFVLIHCLNSYKYGIQTLTNKTYEGLQHAVLCVSLFAAFVSIGPVVHDAAFCVLLAFQVLQFLVYGVVSFVLVQFTDGRLKITCVPTDLQRKEGGIYVFRCVLALSHCLLGLWLHYSINIACFCIDRNVYLRTRRIRAPQNCIDIVFGSNVLLAFFHGAAALVELCLVPAAYAMRRRRQRRSAVYNPISGQKSDVYYDADSEGA